MKLSSSLWCVTFTAFWRSICGGWRSSLANLQSSRLCWSAIHLCRRSLRIPNNGVETTLSASWTFLTTTTCLSAFVSRLRSCMMHETSLAGIIRECSHGCSVAYPSMLNASYSNRTLWERRIVVRHTSQVSCPKFSQTSQCCLVKVVCCNDSSISYYLFIVYIWSMSDWTNEAEVVYIDTNDTK